MSTEVSAYVLKNFLSNDLGIRKIAKDQANDYDIEAKDFAEADKDDNGLDINEILDNADLYEQFATMYLEEQEQREDVDPERDKEKAVAIKDKGQKQA